MLATYVQCTLYAIKASGSVKSLYYKATLLYQSLPNSNVRKQQSMFSNKSMNVFFVNWIKIFLD